MEITQNIISEIKEAISFANNNNEKSVKEKLIRIKAFIDALLSSNQLPSQQINLFITLGNIVINSINSLDDAEEVTEIENENSMNELENSFDLSKVTEENKILFEDIIGNAEAKQALYENIILLFTMEETLRSLIYTGIRRINGSVLLYGPPGCGKTILVQAAANEAKGKLYSVRPSDILSKYQGESERYIRNLFEEALRQPKSIVFFDEFDSIAVARGAADDSIQSRRLLSEILLFLSKLKSIQQNVNIKSNKNNFYPTLSIIAATNRLEDLDEAIVRRFDTKIYVGPMNKCDRQLFIYKSLKDILNNLTVNQIDDISEKTNDWSGSDIEMLCREAAIIPLRRLFNFTSKGHKISSQDIEIPIVTYSDFIEAFNSLLKSSSEDNNQSNQFRYQPNLSTFEGNENP